ncbi:MAG TPA: hypothetical protein V6C97_09230 [Oculatellaceae cyanobacterium]
MTIFHNFILDADWKPASANEVVLPFWSGAMESDFIGAGLLLIVAGSYLENAFSGKISRYTHPSIQQHDI